MLGWFQRVVSQICDILYVGLYLYLAVCVLVCILLFSNYCSNKGQSVFSVISVSSRKWYTLKHSCGLSLDNTMWNGTFFLSQYEFQLKVLIHQHF